jgi:hypothetical protein
MGDILGVLKGVRGEVSILTGPVTVSKPVTVLVLHAGAGCAVARSGSHKAEKAESNNMLQVTNCVCV